MRKKKNLGNLDQVIYFYQDVENVTTKDALGGFVSTWIPALGEVSDTAESGTTTTNIKMTAHGLVSGDYIINGTRNSEVRQVMRVDDDNIAVASVTGQTVGDKILKRLVTSAKVWASVDTIDNYYDMEGQQKTPNVTHIFEIRYRTDISVKFRIKWRNANLEIITFYDLNGQKDRLVIKCRELI